MVSGDRFLVAKRAMFMVTNISPGGPLIGQSVKSVVTNLSILLLKIYKEPLISFSHIVFTERIHFSQSCSSFSFNHKVLCTSH